MSGCPFHAAAPTPTSNLFVDPVPEPVGALRRGLARVGGAMSDVVNWRHLNWRVGRVQLNPFRAILDNVGRGVTGLDARLPHDYLAPLGVLGKGAPSHHAEAFARFERAHGANKERARHAREAGQPLPRHTPDADTFVYAVPNMPLEEFTGPDAVETPWADAGRGALIPVYVIRGPTALRRVLATDPRVDRGPLPYHYLQQAMGSSEADPQGGADASGLFAGRLHDNRTWAKDRRLGLRMFGGRALYDLVDGMSAGLREVEAEIEAHLARTPDAPIDLGVMMSRIAYRMVVRASFGNLDFEAFRVLGELLTDPVRRMLEYVHDQVAGGTSAPELFQADVQETKEIIAEMCDIIREHASEMTEAQRESSLVKLILEGDEDGPLDADRLLTFVLPIIFGGHETTGHTLSWCLYELARDAGLEAHLLEECRRWRREHGDSPPDPGSYAERPWTTALNYEVGRRYPPIVAVPRWSERSGEMPPDPDTGIGAFRYPKDALFLCSILGAHMNPRAWRDPETFDPGRFFEGVDPSMSWRQQGRQVLRNGRRAEKEFRLLTFGAGPAKCLGQAFNHLEVTLVLDHLVPRYRFELVHPDRTVRPSDAAIRGPAPGSLAVRIRRREPTERAALAS